MSGKLQQTYRRGFLKWVVMLVCTVVVILPVPAMAEPGRITRGDVEAVLQATRTGGRMVLFQANESAAFHAAPADWIGSRGVIKPFPSWDGQHYCVDDWHVFLLGFADGGDQSYSIQDAEESFSLLDLTFTLTLDGASVVLDTVRTAIKPDLWEYWEESYGWDKTWAFDEGGIVSPDELGVGEYTLTVDMTYDGTSVVALSIDFFIDPSNSPTCAD